MTRRDIRARPPFGAAAISVTSRTPDLFDGNWLLLSNHPAWNSFGPHQVK
jgi:hypothetical protein